MQSRQKVQSRLPCLRGWKRSSPHPGTTAPPRMHSLVRHEAQTAGSRTLTSSGETSDCTKLNWPIGQTYLQKAASVKKLSTTNAATKYPMAIQAVIHGLFHSEN